MAYLHLDYLLFLDLYEVYGNIIKQKCGDLMKLSHQKLKLLYLMKILLDKTDEEHTITVPQMIEGLSRLGINTLRDINRFCNAL